MGDSINLNKPTIFSVLILSNFLNAGLNRKIFIPDELKSELIKLDVSTFYDEEKPSKPVLKQTPSNRLTHFALVDYFNEEKFYECKSNQEVDELITEVQNGAAHSISWYYVDAHKYSFIENKQRGAWS